MVIYRTCDDTVWQVFTELCAALEQGTLCPTAHLQAVGRILRLKHWQEQQHKRLPPASIMTSEERESFSQAGFARTLTPLSGTTQGILQQDWPHRPVQVMVLSPDPEQIVNYAFDMAHQSESLLQTLAKATQTTYPNFCWEGWGYNPTPPSSIKFPAVTPDALVIIGFKNTACWESFLQEILSEDASQVPRVWLLSLGVASQDALACERLGLPLTAHWQLGGYRPMAHPVTAQALLWGLDSAQRMFAPHV
jgi:hypothetical protein